MTAMQQQRQNTRQQQLDKRNNYHTGRTHFTVHQDNTLHGDEWLFAVKPQSNLALCWSFPTSLLSVRTLVWKGQPPITETSARNEDMLVTMRHTVSRKQLMLHSWHPNTW